MLSFVDGATTFVDREIHDAQTTRVAAEHLHTIWDVREGQSSLLETISCRNSHSYTLKTVAINIYKMALRLVRLISHPLYESVYVDLKAYHLIQ